MIARIRGSRRRNIVVGLLFISPWLIGFILLTAIPIVASLYNSFTRYSGVGSPVWIGLENYKAMFVRDRLFRISVYNTAYYAVIAIPLQIILAIGLALVLNLKVKGVSVFRTLVYMPSIVPVFASSFIWLWLLHPYFGLVNSLLEMVGIRGPGWVVDPAWSKLSIVIMTQWGIGATAMIFLAALQDVPRSLYESAEIDGAGNWAKFINITIPSISPVIFFQLIMTTNGALQMFTQAYIMTDGGPANTTLFYALYLYRKAFLEGKMGFASAMAWLLLLVSLTLTLLLFRSSRRWVFYRGGV